MLLTLGSITSQAHFKAYVRTQNSATIATERFKNFVVIQNTNDGFRIKAEPRFSSPESTHDTAEFISNKLFEILLSFTSLNQSDYCYYQSVMVAFQNDELNVEEIDSAMSENPSCYRVFEEQIAIALDLDSVNALAFYNESELNRTMINANLEDLLEFDAPYDPCAAFNQGRTVCLQDYSGCILIGYSACAFLGGAWAPCAAATWMACTWDLRSCANSNCSSYPSCCSQASGAIDFLGSSLFGSGNTPPWFAHDPINEIGTDPCN